MEEYWKCNKCGNSISTTYGALCTQPMAVRTSGICCGWHTIKLTKEEYEKLLEEYTKNRKDER